MSDGLPSVDPDIDTTDDSPSTPEALDRGGDVRLISDDVSCSNCAHQQICTLQSGIAPMLQNWNAGDDGPPINLNDLAAICDVFLPEDEVNQDQ